MQKNHVKITIFKNYEKDFFWCSDFNNLYFIFMSAKA